MSDKKINNFEYEIKQIEDKWIYVITSEMFNTKKECIEDITNLIKPILIQKLLLRKLGETFNETNGKQ